eukprot:CAMPEP_0171638322 /NCGR_PEP_ID=MMETSP0990-20121206/28862_1 /TAXON_ID=483369 /ORGANISM="non described non described, Strain CCMP2098" /LENGTH=126 /DNA_ID=CAMNT_0012211473 /DNA_START=385 /DNA_END=766 /DNA_ORIENTATION=-
MRPCARRNYQQHSLQGGALGEGSQKASLTRLSLASIQRGARELPDNPLSSLSPHAAHQIEAVVRLFGVAVLNPAGEAIFLGTGFLAAVLSARAPCSICNTLCGTTQVADDFIERDGQHSKPSSVSG